MPKQSASKVNDNVIKTLNHAEGKIANLLSQIAQPNKSWLTASVKDAILKRLSQIQNLSQSTFNMLQATPVSEPTAVQTAEDTAEVEAASPNGTAHQAAHHAAPVAAAAAG